MPPVSLLIFSLLRCICCTVQHSIEQCTMYVILLCVCVYVFGVACLLLLQQKHKHKHNSHTHTHAYIMYFKHSVCNMCTLCHRCYCHRLPFELPKFQLFSTFVCGCGKRHCISKGACILHLYTFWTIFQYDRRSYENIETQLPDPALIWSCCSLIPAFE